VDGIVAIGVGWEGGTAWASVRCCRREHSLLGA
jgi:hypothetical protein